MNIVHHPWNVVYFIGFIAYLTIRGVYARRTKFVQRTHRQVDGLERAVLLLAGLGTMIPSLLYLFTPLLAFANYNPPAFVPWCGVAVMVLALCLFWRPHADLGLNWSVTLEIRSGHRLIEKGVYRSIRHPIYLSIWLWGLAQALMLPNWFAGWSAFVAFAPLYLLRTPREERMMCQLLGDDYRHYIRRTGRLFPRLRR
jgi:protein-S-isoprenylcysteine O-methyltransferase Ste14